MDGFDRRHSHLEYDYQSFATTMSNGRTFVDRHYYRVLIESMVSEPRDPEQNRRELLQEALASVDVSNLPKLT